MARRDPLAVLARLRGIERDAARRTLAEAQAVAATAADAERTRSGRWPGRPPAPPRTTRPGCRRRGG
jgi:hypothetical protein